jgi:hypothetical protein
MSLLVKLSIPQLVICHRLLSHGLSGASRRLREEQMKPLRFHLAATVLLASVSLTLAQGAGNAPGGKIQDRHPSGALIGTTGLTVHSPATEPDVTGKTRPAASPWISPSSDPDVAALKDDDAAPAPRKNARKRARQQAPQQQLPPQQVH